jgi:hypothetical protein
MKLRQRGEIQLSDADHQQIMQRGAHAR